MAFNIQNKKFVKITVVSIVAFILYWVFFLVMWKVSNRDVNNVYIHGMITKNSERIPNETFIFINHYYEGGDYDGFGGIKEYNIRTDSEGFYKIELEKSAYVQILDIDRKSLLLEKYITKKQNKINVIIEE